MHSTVLKLRTGKAATSLAESCASIGAKVGIEPSEPAKALSKHPDVAHRHLAHFESLVEFLHRLDAAIPANPATSTAQSSRKGK